MTNTERLLARMRIAIGKSSKYALAKALHMQHSQLNDVLKGKFGLGPKAVIRIAEELRMDVKDVLVLVEEDKAKTPDDKEFWSRRSPRITASVAAAALAFVAAVKGQDVQASGLDKSSVDIYHAIHYAKLDLRES